MEPEDPSPPSHRRHRHWTISERGRRGRESNSAATVEFTPCHHSGADSSPTTFTTPWRRFLKPHYLGLAVEFLDDDQTSPQSLHSLWTTPSGASSPVIFPHRVHLVPLVFFSPSSVQVRASKCVNCSPELFLRRAAASHRGQHICRRVVASHRGQHPLAGSIPYDS